MEPEHLQGLNRGRLVAEWYCEGEAGDVPNGRGWDNGCLVQTIHLKKNQMRKGFESTPTTKKYTITHPSSAGPRQTLHSSSSSS